MNFEFTKDRQLIDSCLKADHVWRMVTEDCNKHINRKLLFIPIDKFLWVKAENYGVIMVERMDNITCRVHLAFNKSVLGKADYVYPHLLAWLFKNTSYLSVEALIPSFNKLAGRLARLSGMRFIGNKRVSFLKNGVMHDQFLYEINRRDICF